MQRQVVLEDDQLAYAFKLIHKSEDNLKVILKLYGLTLVEFLRFYSFRDTGCNNKINIILGRAILCYDENLVHSACRHYPFSIMKVALTYVDRPKCTRIISSIFTELIHNGNMTLAEMRIMMATARANQRNNVKW